MQTIVKNLLDWEPRVKHVFCRAGNYQQNGFWKLKIGPVVFELLKKHCVQLEPKMAQNWQIFREEDELLENGDSYSQVMQIINEGLGNIYSKQFLFFA